jgi:hypothetical protein
MWGKRLPIVARPRDGESLYGIAERTAVLNFTTMGSLFPIKRLADWRDPSVLEIELLSVALGVDADELTARTVGALLPSGRHITSSSVPYLRHGQAPLSCPLCRMHRPEFELKLVFACPSCRSILSSECGHTPQVSQRAIEIQTQLVDWFRIEPPRQTRYLTRNRIELCQWYLRQLSLSLGRVANSHEARRLRKHGFTRPRLARKRTGIPEIGLVELACALPLAWEASSPKAASLTTGARWRFESVDWTGMRKAGQDLLREGSLNDYLRNLGISADHVPRLLVTDGSHNTAAVRSAWISVSAALMNVLVKLEGNSPSINAILASLRVGSSARKIIAAMTTIVDDTVLAAAASELSSPTVDYSRFRNTEDYSPWRARLDRAVSRARTGRRTGEFWLGQSRDSCMSENDLTVAARIANEAFKWTSDDGDDFVAALDCDMRSIAELIEWDRHEFRKATLSKPMHDGSHVHHSRMVNNRAITGSR